MDCFKFTRKPYCILYIYVEFNYYFIIEETNIIKTKNIYIYIYRVAELWLFVRERAKINIIRYNISFSEYSSHG
jgi:hypothetical protein